MTKFSCKFRQSYPKINRYVSCLTSKNGVKISYKLKVALIDCNGFFGFSFHEDKLSVIVVIQLAKGWSLARETKFHLLRTRLFHYYIKSFVFLLFFFEFTAVLSHGAKCTRVLQFYL